MPPNVKKKKKQKKSKVSSALEPAPSVQVKALLKAYQSSVYGHSTYVSPSIEEDLRQGIDKNQFVSKFVLSGGPTNKPVSLSCLIQALRAVCYMKIREIYCWRTPISDSDIIDMALLLETPCWKNVSTIELIDTGLSDFALGRLSRTFPVGRLKKLVLDYNRFGDEGMANLLVCLSGNTELKHLSVNYCDLTIPSGALIAELLTKSTIVNLEITGNALQCDGTAQLIDVLCTQDIPLKSLLIADNGIDSHGKGNQRGPFMTAKVMRRWLTCTQYLELCDLRDNDIGDLAARELMDGLTDRGTAGLKNIQLLVTCRIDAVIYKTIQSLAKKSKGGSKKKKKRKKK